MLQDANFETHIEIVANISEDKFQQPVITLLFKQR